MRWQSIALLPIFSSWRFPQTGFGRGWRGREKKRWGPNTSHKTPSPAKDPRRQQLLLAACFENLDRKDWVLKSKITTNWEKYPLTKQLHEKCSPKYKSAWYVSPIPNVSTRKPAADSVIMKQNWHTTKLKPNFFNSRLQTHLWNHGNHAFSKSSPESEKSWCPGPSLHGFSQVIGQVQQYQPSPKPVLLL